MLRPQSAPRAPPRADRVDENGAARRRREGQGEAEDLAPALPGGAVDDGGARGGPGGGGLGVAQGSARGVRRRVEGRGRDVDEVAEVDGGRERRAVSASAASALAATVPAPPPAPPAAAPPAGSPPPHSSPPAAAVPSATAT